MDAVTLIVLNRLHVLKLRKLPELVRLHLSRRTVQNCAQRIHGRSRTARVVSRARGQRFHCVPAPDAPQQVADGHASAL